MNFISFIKDIIAPKKCYCCKKQGHFLCQKCLSTLSNFQPICYVCKKPSEDFEIHKGCKDSVYFDNLFILTHYNNKIIQRLIKDSKFYGKKDILEDFGNYLGNLLKDFLGEEKRSNFIVSPVPMYFLRKLKRGYNQSEVLSKFISKNLKIKLEKTLVKRVKNTKQQSKLNKKERLHNLENAFKINKNLLGKINKKIIILVDDVVSTGSTINEISKNLKLFGVKKIIVVVIASD